MLLLIVGPELDLALEASELTGLVEGDGVGAVQDVVSCLGAEKGDKRPAGSGGAPPCPCLSPCRPPPGPPYLHVEKVQLDGVTGVHVLVRVEELPPEQKRLVLLHPLLPQGPAVVQPVHWDTEGPLSARSLQPLHRQPFVFCLFMSHPLPLIRSVP